MTVSVVIPVFNGEKHIARAIESVLAQTYPASEIIVINDGSKDKTEELLRSFGDHIRFKTIPNGGVSNARNTGIAMAQGDSIAFLDADDIWHPQKLEKQLKVFEQYPEVGFCCCDYSIVDPYRKKVVNHFVVLKDKVANFNEPLKILPMKLLLEVNFVGTCSTVVIRKELLDKVGVFNKTYRQSEDFDLWLRLAMHTKFVLLSDVLVDKKSHGANLTNNLKESYAFHQTVLADIKVSFEEYLKCNGLTKNYAAAISKTHYKQGELYFNEGFFKVAFSHYWLALCAHITLGNLAHFLWIVFRKSLRCLSGGLISRKTLDKILLQRETSPVRKHQT